MRTYAAELIGTFTLVFAGTGAIVVNDVSHGTVGHQGIALTFGLVVMAMIYAIGDISGAHINPAVTLAFTVAGRLKPGQAAPYVVSQLLGACAASLLLLAMFPDHSTLGATLPSGLVSTSFIFEVVLTFILMLVVLNVSTGAHEEGITAATAVGGVVAMEAMFAGPICGASMNPARSIGPALMSGQTQHLWLYIAAPVIGALLAVPVTVFLRAPESTPE